MKKMWLLSVLLALPLVSAAGPLEFIGDVWNRILMIGGISFLQGFGLVAFTRILIWILTFALFFAVMSLGAGGESGKRAFAFLKRNHAMVIAAVLATISAIFLPAAAILAVGTGWATAVGLILIGAPIVGLGYVLWNIPGKDANGKSQETRGTVLLKLLISLLLFWILSAMNYSLQSERGVDIGSASVAGTMANFLAWALYIASIMILWYIVKFFLVGRNDEEDEKQWREGGEKARKWFGQKLDDQKAREENAKRAQSVSEPKSYLVNAIDACEGLLTALYRSARTTEERKVAVDKAEKQLKHLKKNLKKAVRSLRYLRRKEKGKIYEVFDNLYSHAGVALSTARNVSLPKPTADNWEQSLAAIHGGIMGPQGVRSICGAIIRALDAFVEHQETQLSQATASHRAEQQTQERAQQQEQRQEAAQTRAKVQAAARGKRMASRSVAAVRRRK